MLTKKYIDMNVYDATMKRLAFIFNKYDNVLVSFSGGKDSGVCLNLCYQYAKEHGCMDKLAIMHVDYEAQYNLTTEYVTKCFVKEFPEITRKYWLCLPVSVPCATSMTDNFWVPWESAKKDIWMRKMPDNDFVINESNVPFKFESGNIDYNVQDDFARWFADKNGSTAVCLGIRTDESLDRYRMLNSESKINAAYNKSYLIGDEKLCKACVIYDWKFDDVFVANSKFGFAYNKIYDLFYQAGVPFSSMRVASPFLSQGIDSLKLYRVIEPNTWSRLIGRVNGVNFSGIYGGTTAMGWRNITLPEGHTWKSYVNFLLSTLPEETRNLYLKKFKVSIDFWLHKGGVLSDETIAEIQQQNIPIKLTKKPNAKKYTVTFESYPDDLNVKDFRSVPSYKRMCVCIMKNDVMCTYMGFSITKAEEERRKAIVETYKILNG